MIKKILFSILTLSSMTIFSQEVEQNKSGTKIEVYIIGRISTIHFNPEVSKYQVFDFIKVENVKEFINGQLGKEFGNAGDQVQKVK